MKSLTQVEAEERAALVAVEQYDIAVDLTDLPTGPRVRTTSTIIFSCRTPGAGTFVDAAARVLRATLNGSELGPAIDGRLTLPGLAEENTLVVECEQVDTRHGPGVHKAVDPSDDEVYLWMTFEPDEARYVWACFDQPDLKAPHSFTVTAPASWTVTSNSGDAAVTAAGDARVWEFRATPPLSPYNTVINAGPFYELRRHIDGYDLGLFCRRSLGAVLDRNAEKLFRLTGQGLRFYGEQFAMPFPQKRYDQVFVPERGGAMENYGCVTWGDSFLYRTDTTPAEEVLLARILLHEMAHMWFGNIVTMRWWDDLWLNEAFAEFAGKWAATAATDHTDAWVWHLVVDKLDAYLADQGPTAHSIRQPIADVAHAASIFDPTTYTKGASILRQLQAYIGEEAFRAGLIAYFAKFAWRNTTLQDLINEFATVSGKDLDAWQDGWLATAGTDRLALKSNGDQLVLEGSGPTGPPRPQVLMVSAYQQQGQALVRTKRAIVEVQSERTPVDLPAGADFYLVNDEDLTFAAIPSTGTEWAARLPTPIARGVAVAAAWNALIAGESTAAETVACLVSVLRVETSHVVIEPYLRMAADVAEFWAPEVERATVTAMVAEVCTELARQSPRRTVALRALARVTTDIDRLWDAVAGDVDLGWRALARESELGGEIKARAEDLLMRDPDPDARFRVMTVRAAAPDPAAKADAWQALADLGAVPIGAFRQMAAAFWRPGQDDLLLPYAEKYLTLLAGMHRGGLNFSIARTRCLFPVFAGDETLLERAQKAAAGEVTPLVAKALRERTDEVARMIRTRSLAPNGRPRPSRDPR